MIHEDGSGGGFFAKKTVKNILAHKTAFAVINNLSFSTVKLNLSFEVFCNAPINFKNVIWIITFQVKAPRLFVFLVFGKACLVSHRAKLAVALIFYMQLNSHWFKME